VSTSRLTKRATVAPSKLVAAGIALIGGIGLMAASASATPAAARMVGSAARVGAAPAVPTGALAVGALPAATRLLATVAFEPSSPAALAAYATAVSTRGNVLDGKYLTTAQFAARFGPSASTIAAVRGVLQRDGLRPSPVTPDHLAVGIRGTAAQFSRAFGTGFILYRLANGRLAYANTRAPRLPASIATAVQAVIGLDNLASPHPEDLVASTRAGGAAAARVATGGPQPCTAAQNEGSSQGAYTANQLASAYSFSSLYGAGDLGAGQTVAIYELEPNLKSDIAAYQKCYGTTTNVTYVKVDGGTGTGAGSGEASLDIEDVIGLVPEAKILVYQAPNTGTGAYDEYNSIIGQDRANVISTSWGLCESEEGSSAADAELTLFEEAATQRQSVLAAAGDDGSEDCGTNALAVDDPGTDPYVTSVGGLKLSKLGPPPTESVWDDSVGSGGGGISEFWEMPTYQSGARKSLHVIGAKSSGKPCGASKGTYCREVPDVSANADPYTGYVVYHNGHWTTIGGTSAAAPLFAAFIALTNASTACAGTNVGFLNPSLYSIAGTAYSANFYDIKSGNNDWTGSHPGDYAAGAGFDMASGLGAPDGATLSAALC
jgi:subtilase family serine protease